jgi:hypothetical protein
VMQLLAGGRRLPPAPGSRPVDHAQQSANREFAADAEPFVELAPRSR